MKALAIVVVVAALGFGGYKLYEKRKASQTRLAFTYLVCDSDFMDEASGALREIGGMSRDTSINGMIAVAQKSMEHATTLAGWTRAHVPADKVSALAGASSLSKQQLGQAVQEGYDAAKLRCPDKLEGINPGAVGMIVGLLIAALASSGG